MRGWGPGYAGAGGRARRGGDVRRGANARGNAAGATRQGANAGGKGPGTPAKGSAVGSGNAARRESAGGAWPQGPGRENPAKGRCSQKGKIHFPTWSPTAILTGRYTS